MQVEANNTHLAEQQDVFGLRWLVKSQSKPSENYHVDLTNDLEGCQCKWHTMTYAPQIKLGNSEHHCFHWRVASNAANEFARKFLIELDKQQNQQ